MVVIPCRVDDSRAQILVRRTDTDIWVDGKRFELSEFVIGDVFEAGGCWFLIDGVSERVEGVLLIDVDGGRGDWRHPKWIGDIQLALKVGQLTVVVDEKDAEF